MKSKKILVLLPDGVGLRNFAFTSFVEIGERMGWKVIFWNLTPFDLTQLGFSELKTGGSPNPKTDLYKRAKIETELNYFTEKFNDPVYQTYKFPSSNKGLKNKIKNFLVTFLMNSHKGEKGLGKLRQKLKASEKKGEFYRQCKKILQEENPDMVFCTNQRPITAIAPITAAQDLGVPTSTFIFSWDNLPKATMVVEADQYFVWSDYMKKELLQYYPFINADKVHVTGSPQFEPHFDKTLQKEKEFFFEENNLNLDRDYICFSGDDITTCPDDPEYLNDIADAIRYLNLQGHNLGIIFRRSPVDLSCRYDKVLRKHQDIIVPLAPKWRKIGHRWNTIFPMEEDLQFQVNTIAHSKAVINLASSMVFDFAIFNKPCLYINYNAQDTNDHNWNPQKVYNFVHFRSMPTREEVVWINSKDEIITKIKIALSGAANTTEKAKNWFEQINVPPACLASKRIWKAITEINEQGQ